MRAVLFTITGWIGGGPARATRGQGGVLPARPAATPASGWWRRAQRQAMLRWSEIEAMQAAGTFEFHSHTHTHTAGTRSAAMTRT